MSSAGEISGQPGIKSALWLLVGLLMQISNERSKLRKATEGTVEETMNPGRCNRAKSNAQGYKKCKEKPEAKGNKGRGDFGARPNPAQLL